jgi:PadR family transcriptional regulator PadR
MAAVKASSARLREFELVVLLAVLAVRAETHPRAIRNEIERRSGRIASRAAVFITLERLEAKGFVTSRFGDPTPTRGGRAKRLFRATALGTRAALASVRTVSAMSFGLVPGTNYR